MVYYRNVEAICPFHPLFLDRKWDFSLRAYSQMPSAYVPHSIYVARFLYTGVPIFIFQLFTFFNVLI